MNCPSCGYNNVPIHSKKSNGDLRYICYACHNTFVDIRYEQSNSTPLIQPVSKYRSALNIAKIDKQHLFITVIILAITIFFLAKLIIIHFSMIINPFPNEYREGAIILSTKLIVEGGNPYTWANQPEYSNNYGIIYHLVVYPFAKIFGATLLIHRIISAFFIFASCLLLFMALIRMKVSAPLCLIGATILYAHLLYFAAPLARCDSLGMFLFLCSIYIPWRFNYSQNSLLCSITVGMLAFLTKPYFILAIFYVGIYVFIFKAKKLGVKYFLAIAISLTSTILLMNVLFECYWNNTFFVNSGSSIVMEYPAYAGIQIYRYVEYNLAIIAILFLAAFNLSKKIEKQVLQFTMISNSSIYRYINLTNLDKPLIDMGGFANIEWILYTLLSLAIFYFKLGKHDGSWLVYIHHLISPFLITIALQFVSKKQLGKLILIVLLCLNLFSITKPDFLQEAQSDNTTWHEMEVVLSQHKDILNSPAIVPLLIDQRKAIYDSGLTEYFQYGIKRNFFGIHLPDNQQAKERNEQFMQTVTNKIEAKEFDLVTMTNRHSLFISEEELKKYYQYTKSIVVPMTSSFQSWKLDIWEPKL